MQHVPKHMEDDVDEGALRTDTKLRYSNWLKRKATDKIDSIRPKELGGGLQSTRYGRQYTVQDYLVAWNGALASSNSSW